MVQAPRVSQANNFEQLARAHHATRRFQSWFLQVRSTQNIMLHLCTRQQSMMLKKICAQKVQPHHIIYIITSWDLCWVPQKPKAHEMWTKHWEGTNIEQTWTKYIARWDIQIWASISRGLQTILQFHARFAHVFPDRYTLPRPFAGQL